MEVTNQQGGGYFFYNYFITIQLSNTYAGKKQHQIDPVPQEERNLLNELKVKPQWFQ